MSLSAGTRLGPYEIQSALGAGGMGEVYRARDRNLNRDVALKVLPESFAADADRVARFQREAQLLASLNHPNIAGIYGIEASTSTVSLRALVMELVEGEDLSTIVARGPVPWHDALPIARQIADALEAAHEAGIVHRDLKPQNIKVRADGMVKVLDFGLAKALDPTEASSGPAAMNSPTMTAPATQMGMILGTAAYMSPEQARGKAVDRRADIWAFGAVLYEMLTGRRAFEGDDISITLANVLKEDVTWAALPVGLPPSVDRLLRRCLEKDPRRRLSAIGDARLELDDTSVAPEVPRAPMSRFSLPWIIAAVATLVALTSLGVTVFGARSRPVTPVWTSIPAPVQQFRRGAAPAVSPNGQWIVFPALDEQGQDQLWLRALSEQTSTRLPGTENAVSPFWSPDSLSFAFFRDGKLMTMPLQGGTPRALADASGTPRGGTWNRDGDIVFVPAPGLGLYVVSASSGAAAEPLKDFVAAPGLLPMYPSFLPDGKRFLYTTSSDDESWINVGSLVEGTTTKIVKAYSRAEYADGYLLWGSQGALFAQPFDTETLSLSGERQRVVESLGSGMGHPVNYGFSVSADGAVLVAGNTPFLPLSRLTWFDRSGAQTGTLGEPGHLFGFSVSPNWTMVALERFDPRTNSIDPWVTQIDTGFSTPLRASAEGALASAPTWSHDGTRLFHSSGYGTLRATTLSGGDSDGWVIGAHWPTSAAPDGSVVLITQQNTPFGNDLMAVSLTGDHTPRPYIQTPFNESNARFSPDGAFVAYVSNETGQPEVYLQSFPRLGVKRRVSITGGAFPAWNEDGSELYFARDESDGTRSLMVARIVGGVPSPPQRVFGGMRGVWEGNRSGFAVFDRGRRFLASVLVPVAAPQVITVGQHWIAGLKTQ